VSAVEVTSLVRRFGSMDVLSGLDLVVEPGEHITVTGPNGAGKTTLLRVLSGLLRPTSGRVEVLDGDTGDPSVRRRIGVIAHSPSLYARMTALENVRFWGNLYDAPDAADRGGELLTELGLDPADKRVIGSYSQGMRQRVGVARAFCISPDLVIADEPFAGLDADGAKTVESLLNKANTVVAALHDRSRLSGAKVYALARGRLERI